MANNELGQGNSYDLSKLHEVQDQKQLFVNPRIPTRIWIM